MAQRVPRTVANKAVISPIIALCPKLDNHSGLVNSFSKWRKDNSPSGIDKNRFGVSETGIAIKAGITRNSSKTHAPVRLNIANSPAS